MGFRFRRTMKIAPGLRLNINKGSVGISAGVRGARTSINTKGDRHSTLGIPGSGLSHTTRSSGSKDSSAKGQESSSNIPSNMSPKEARVYLMENIDHLGELDFETKFDREKLLVDKELRSIYRRSLLKVSLLQIPIMLTLGGAIFYALGWYYQIWIALYSIYVFGYGVRNMGMTSCLKSFKKKYKDQVSTAKLEKSDEYSKKFELAGSNIIDELSQEEPYIQLHITSTLPDEFLKYGLQTKQNSEAAFNLINNLINPEKILDLTLEYGLSQEIQHLVSLSMFSAKTGNMEVANEYIKPLCSSRKKVLSEDKHVFMYFYAHCLEEGGYSDLALSEFKKVKRKYPGFMDTDEKIEKLNQLKKTG